MNKMHRTSPNQHRGSRKRFANNFLGYGYTQAVTLAVQFLTVPFFLHYWGNVGYAEWLVLSGFPIMLGLLDLGVAHASASKAIMLSVRNDIDGIRRSLQTALAFSLGVCCFILLIGAISANAIDWATLLKLSSLSNQKAGQTLLWLSAYLCVNLLGNPLNAWFRAIDRTATGIFLLANRRLLDVVITLTVLATGGDAVQLAISMFTGQAFFLFGLVLYARHCSPWPMLGLSDASMQELRSVIRPATAHIGITIGQAMTLQGGVQILNQIAPETVVVIYSMSRTLMRLVLQLGVVCSHAMRPVLGRLLGTGDVIKAATFSKRVTQLAILAASIGYALLIWTGPYVVQIWSGGKATTNHSDLAIIGIHALLNVAWYVPAAYQMAGNNHARLVAIYFTGCTIGIGIWGLYPFLLSPLHGAAISLAMPEFFVLILSAILAGNQKKVKP